ncbi:MAG: caspase family protein [Planctomycetota bacterium]|nr:caspase family protein [Planctomycetota bacterium]
MTRVAWCAAGAWLLGAAAGAAQPDRTAGLDEALRSVSPGMTTPNRWALLIGIDQYRDARIQRLDACVRDVTAMRDALIHPGIGMFPAPNVTTLTNEQATRAAVIKALRDLTSRIGPQDLVIVFYSGHGMVEASEQFGAAAAASPAQATLGYWVTYDTEVDNLEGTALSALDVNNRLQNIRTSRLIAIVDACHAAATAEAAKVKSAFSLAELLPTFNGNGRVRFASCLESEQSLTINEGEGKGHSVFAWSLIEGLRGAAAGEDGVLTVDEWWAYVSRRAPDIARRLNSVQTPTRQGESTGDFLVAIDQNRLLEVHGRHVAAVTVTQERVATITQLAIDGTISVELAVEARELLQADPESLDPVRRARRKVFQDLADTVKGKAAERGSRSLAPDFVKGALAEHPLRRAGDEARPIPANPTEWLAREAETDPWAAAILGALLQDPPKNWVRYADERTFVRMCRPDERGRRVLNEIKSLWHTNTVVRDNARALEYFRRAADGGIGCAAVELADMSRTGLGTLPDDAESLRWTRRAVELGSGMGMLRLGQRHAEGRGVPRDPAAAMEWYRKAADAGDPGGMLELGWALETGSHGRQDAAEAFAWYQRGAALDDGGCTYRAALCLLNGVGTPRNAEQAVVALRKAADLGAEEAIVELAKCYESGVGVSKSLLESRRLYRVAAEKGSTNPECLRHAAVSLLNGTRAAEDDRQMLEWFRAAARSDAEASNWLGRCHEEGWGVAKDDAEAFTHFETAAKRGLAVGMYNVATFYAGGRGVRRNEAQAFEWYRRAADAGYAQASTEVGRRYHYGVGTERSEREALAYFTRAAGTGDAAAIEWLGVYHQNGYAGLTKDGAEAVRHYERAFAAGRHDCANSIGVVYFDGKGVPVNAAKGVEWFAKADEHNVPMGSRNLGWAYQTGLGTTKDLAKARTLYEKAVRLGSSSAMVLLAKMHRAGTGGPRNSAEATRLFTLAAEQGESEAMLMLGIDAHDQKQHPAAATWFRKSADAGDNLAMNWMGHYFENGYGVTKDLAEALVWYKKAAELGNEVAMWNLALCYDEGKGTTKDPAEALRWFRESARKGNQSARDLLTNRKLTW